MSSKSLEKMEDRRRRRKIEDAWKSRRPTPVTRAHHSVPEARQPLTRNIRHAVRKNILKALGSALILTVLGGGGYRAMTELSCNGDAKRAIATVYGLNGDIDFETIKNTPALCSRFRARLLKVKQAYSQASGECDSQWLAPDDLLNDTQFVLSDVEGALLEACPSDR